MEGERMNRRNFIDLGIKGISFAGLAKLGLFGISQAMAN